MQRYLVEAHCALEADALARAVRLCAGETRQIRSVFVPEDQICFHLIEAQSLEAATAAIASAEIAHARIVEAIEWHNADGGQG